MMGSDITGTAIYTKIFLILSKINLKSIFQLLCKVSNNSNLVQIKQIVTVQSEILNFKYQSQCDLTNILEICYCIVKQTIEIN